MSEQQRRFPRMSSENTILVVQVGDRQLDQFARTHTVGLGGCGFVCEQDLGGEGSEIKLMISVRPRAFQTRARVAYQRPLTDDSFEVGVEFLDLGEEERLVIEALFQTQLPDQDGSARPELSG